MIDWNKPIETVDGRKARLVEANIETGRIIVYTYSGSGDVFLVNEEGYRCDDRAIYSKRQEPFIRNARVKREGWVVARASIAAAPIIERTRLYATQEEAQAGCVWEKSFPMFVSWEE